MYLFNPMELVFVACISLISNCDSNISQSWFCPCTHVWKIDIDKSVRIGTCMWLCILVRAFRFTLQYTTNNLISGPRLDVLHNSPLATFANLTTQQPPAPCNGDCDDNGHSDNMKPLCCHVYLTGLEQPTVRYLFIKVSQNVQASAMGN